MKLRSLDAMTDELAGSAGKPLPELLSIGRFARACRLSVKALRHYDEVGLLEPARVDGSGYRFYARSQIKTAISISLLRSLDVPIPAIESILNARQPSRVAERLADERHRIEREMARSRQALSCVERMMREGDVLPYTVAIRNEPAHGLLSRRTVTTPERHVEAGFELFEALAKALREAGLPISDPVQCLLPEPEDEDTMILQMCVPAVPGATPAGLTRLELPASRVAFTTHIGAYEEIGIAQYAVAAWVHEQGHRPAGSPREIYLDDPREVPAAERRTELVIPIAS
jgi:DNA-binding transcriptional MerR regulator/predicted transcriptional regulator YdeE